MKLIRILYLALIAVGLAASTDSLLAHEGHHHDSMPPGQLVPITAKDADWVASQKAAYPTDVCVVSGDKLSGDMGKPVDFIYREDGKPDRLVIFCCKDCVKDFNKDPEKYLKLLDEAAAKKSAEHMGHQHGS